MRAPSSAASAPRTDEARLVAEWRRQLDEVVTAVARDAQGRIHPDLLRMPMLALALSQAALRSVGAEQLTQFLTWCVRAGLQPGKHVEADIVTNPTTGVLELQPRIVFPTLADAESCRLPGKEQDFKGHGGQPIGRCRTPLLREVVGWIESPIRPNRRIQYARLRAAIDMVLRARPGATPPQESAS